MELASCAAKIEEPANFLYEMRFVRGLKRRIRHKANLFPQRYPLDGLNRIRTVRDFDDLFTAPFCGFRDAADYYAQSSAAQLLRAIGRPTLIVAAQDDPVVPFAAFENGDLRDNPNIRLLAPKYGGHCAFISEESGGERFWSEARIVEFCTEHAMVGRS
jgi:predicted alpha/beta-fold hydrolase